MAHSITFQGGSLVVPGGSGNVKNNLGLKLRLALNKKDPNPVSDIKIGSFYQFNWKGLDATNGFVPGEIVRVLGKRKTGGYTIRSMSRGLKFKNMKMQPFAWKEVTDPVDTLLLEVT